MNLSDRFNQGINDVISILKRGGSVVYPTDTCYGLGVDAENIKAVRRMYLIKNRSLTQPTSILVSDIEMAKRYVIFCEIAEIILKEFSTEFFQKPMTLILPLKKKVPKAIKLLSAESGCLGIRISNSIISNEIIKKLNKPITTSSANPAKGHSPYSTKESKSQFQNKRYRPTLYLDGGTLNEKPSSTIIKIIDRKATLRKITRN